MLINSIELPEHVARGYEFLSNLDDTPDRTLRGLKKVNIFIGPNNSGKSRLLRSLFHDLDGITFQPDIEHYNEALTLYREAYNSVTSLKADHQKFHSGFADTVKFPLIEPSDWILAENAHQLSTLKDYLFTIDSDKVRQKMNHEPGRIVEMNSLRHVELIEGAVKSVIKNLEQIDPELLQIHRFIRLYIPTLRGLRRLVTDQNQEPIASQAQDLYQETVQQSYFPSKADIGIKREIFTGYSLYESIRMLKNGSEEQQDALKDFEKLLSEFFDGRPVSLNPNYTTPGVVWIKVGNEKSRQIFNLGDGLQHLVILLFPIFQRRQEKILYFIEELELFLHPGLQRALISIFTGDRFPKLQVFIATHSNHLLDMTLDYEKLAVYRSSRLNGDAAPNGDQGFLVKKLTGRDMSVLEDLGVKNSSVFLTNCTIWVEGITDRHYIRAYLRLYLQDQSNISQTRKFREDTHYSFVEYGGANMSHWSLSAGDEAIGLPDSINIENLCGPAFLVMDNDGVKKDEAHQNIINILGEARTHRTIGKEIENSLSPNVIAKILLSSDLKKISPLPPPEEVLGSVARLSKASSGKLPGMGVILDGILAQYNLPPKYADPKSKTGSLKSGLKKSFCHNAVRVMDELGMSSLSDEGRALAAKIITFIEKQNS